MNFNNDLAFNFQDRILQLKEVWKIAIILLQLFLSLPMSLKFYIFTFIYASSLFYKSSICSYFSYFRDFQYTNTM